MRGRVDRVTDDERSGSCPTCFLREPRHPLICDADRSKLHSWLREIPELLAELDDPQDAPPVERDLVKYPPGHEHVGQWVPHLDRLGDALPAGTVAGQMLTGPVSGSSEPRLPIRVNLVDLKAPARRVYLLGEDQIGYESVASELDFWVRDWREARGGRERLPEPTVPELASWLERRTEDAADAHPAIDEMFGAIRRIRLALLGQLGKFDIPDYKKGVPCPRCDRLTLLRENGSDFISCGSCPQLLTPAEFDRWTGQEAAYRCGEKVGDRYCWLPKKHDGDCEPFRRKDEAA